MSKHRRVEILSKQEIFSRLFFKFEEIRLRHELLNGQMSDELLRLNMERGDGVSAVLYNVSLDEVILIEQFRYAGYVHGNGWLLELPAGIAADQETPKAAMKRELLEETGYKVKKLEHISTFYLSPGGSTERIFLYYAPVTAQDKVAQGGGLPAEKEEIRIVPMKLDKALRQIASGKICDAKTIIGLQWLAARKGMSNT